jgi:sulfide:quinone oxidoreductase
MGPAPSLIAVTAGRAARFEAVIAGAGVAGLEAALALRELAGERVRVTMVSPETHFTYRPMRVREPFGYSAARQYPLGDIAQDIGAEFVHDSFKWLDAQNMVVHTAGGAAFGYDALLLAMGARPHPAFRHGVTIDDRRLDEQLHGLIQDVEMGYVGSIAFIAAGPVTWPLPIYELALMTARRAHEMQIEVAVTLVTHEDAPLALFGSAVSDAVADVLSANCVRVVTSALCRIPQAGEVSFADGRCTLHVDRIVALPQLFGPSTPGVPGDSSHGFIPIDRYCGVRGLERVFAAGDATDFPVKHGGVAAQQADTAASAIAALAGAPIAPRAFNPEIHGMLLGGEAPLYISAQISGSHGVRSRVSETPSWSPGSKIAAKYLGAYLSARGRMAQPVLR